MSIPIRHTPAGRIGNYGNHWQRNAKGIMTEELYKGQEEGKERKAAFYKMFGKIGGRRKPATTR